MGGGQQRSRLVGIGVAAALLFAAAPAVAALRLETLRFFDPNPAPSPVVRFRLHVGPDAAHTTSIDIGMPAAVAGGIRSYPLLLGNAANVYIALTAVDGAGRESLRSNGIMRAPRGPAFDHDADGVSDLLRIDTAGGGIEVLRQGSDAGPQLLPLSQPKNSSIVARGDFDGNGTSDILWQRKGSRMLTRWLLGAGGNVLSERMPTPHPQLRLLGTGDLDGNSRDDVVFEDAGRAELHLWLVGATWVPQQEVIEGLPAPWRLLGIGDVEADRRSDLVWWDPSSGAIRIWHMNGRTVLEDTIWVAVGDPMEAALDAYAHRVGVVIGDEVSDHPEVARYPFDSRRRRMSLMTTTRLYVKGAPDAVFPVCSNASQAAFRAVEALSARGLRVLAVATGAGSEHPVSDATAIEHDLELLGLIGLEDPPRPSAAASVAACRSAGVKIALVTGDHPSTAKAIADEVGIYLPGAPVLIGSKLPRDDGLLAAQVDRDGAVISRVTPEDKLRIARALQSRGHVVAMTGDGVNDGPALREADIGVAMGRSGADVARDAADLVLLDDDLGTIVTAIGQGRTTFANARRFLTYHLTDNVAEITPFLIWALSGSRIPLALGVLQILALDLGTDTLSATALGAEPAHHQAWEERPSSGRLLDRKVAFRAFGLLGPIEALTEMAAFFAVFIAVGWRPGQSFPAGALAAASGAAFATVVLAQTANAFACRSATRPAWRIPLFSNRLLIGAALVELTIAAVFLLVPSVATLLGHEAPSGTGWTVALAAIPLLLIVDGLHKTIRRLWQAQLGTGEREPTK